MPVGGELEGVPLRYVGDWGGLGNVCNYMHLGSGAPLGACLPGGVPQGCGTVSAELSVAEGTQPPIPIHVV